MHNVQPQPDRVIVTAIERDPGEWPVLDRAGPPLGYQSGLAETRRSADKDELGGGARQVADELGSLHQLQARAGSIELGLDRRVRPHARGRSGHRPLTALPPETAVTHLSDTAPLRVARQGSRRST